MDIFIIFIVRLRTDQWLPMLNMCNMSVISQPVLRNVMSNKDPRMRGNNVFFRHPKTKSLQSVDSQLTFKVLANAVKQGEDILHICVQKMQYKVYLQGINFFFLFIYFYQLEANYFTTFQWVLSYIDMNQPWSYMYYLQGINFYT